MSLVLMNYAENIYITYTVYTVYIYTVYISVIVNKTDRSHKGKP